MISITDTNPVLNRTIAPPIKDAVEFNLTLKPCTKFSLSNGAPLYYINDGTEEVTLVEMVFNAGNSFENKNLVASATNYLLKNGTSKKTALEINEHFDQNVRLFQAQFFYWYHFLKDNLWLKQQGFYFQKNFRH